MSAHALRTSDDGPHVVRIRDFIQDDDERLLIHRRRPGENILHFGIVICRNFRNHTLVLLSRRHVVQLKTIHHTDGHTLFLRQSPDDGNGSAGTFRHIDAFHIVTRPQSFNHRISSHQQVLRRFFLLKVSHAFALRISAPESLRPRCTTAARPASRTAVIIYRTGIVLPTAIPAASSASVTPLVGTVSAITALASSFSSLIHPVGIPAILSVFLLSGHP